MEKAERRREREARPRTLAQERNQSIPKRVDQFPTLRDFYNTYDELVVTERDREEYRKFLSTLGERERQFLQAGLNFYLLDFKNVGGLVMPLILRVDYAEGTSEELRLPAEIWRYNHSEVTRMVVTKKEIASVTLDPRLETADVDTANNSFPRRPARSRFQLFKERTRTNPMQQLEQKTKTGEPNKP